MKNLGRNLIIGGWCLLLPLQAAAFDGIAAEGEDNGTIALFAAACENIRAGEAKSSVRIRASDKASFKAVENIPELSDYRNSFSGHDFNVLVYHIVDNYLEDMTVKTSEQTDDKLCVEVSGYLSADNILKAFNENFNKFENPSKTANTTEKIFENDYPESLDLEETAVNTESSLQLPPKPQPELKEEIRAETVLRQNDAEKRQNIFADEDDATVVFIEKTKFFNNTETATYFNDIKEIVTAQRGVAVGRDKSQADYVIKAEVLKAKVDPINKQTNRLQMVLALQLTDNATGNSIIEHQNRFILFESSEDEQKVASNLMKKLLRKAGEQINSKIRVKDRQPVSDARMEPVITPTSPSYPANRQPAEIPSRQ